MYVLQQPPSLQNDRRAHIVGLLKKIFKFNCGWKLMKHHVSLITCHETTPKHYCSVFVIMCVVRLLCATPHPANPHTG